MECEQQFSLSWNNFHGNVSRELSGLLGSGTLADVTLAVGGELLQAHRLVLAICSPYFKRMFQTNPHQHPIVVLRDVTYQAMRDLLQFMYHGEVSVKSEDLTAFIATAELLQIKGLTNKEPEEKETPPHKTKTEESTPETNTESSEQTEIIKRKYINDSLQRLKKRTSEYLQNLYQCDNKRPRSDVQADQGYGEVKAEYDDIVVTDPAVGDYKEIADTKVGWNEDNHTMDLSCNGKYLRYDCPSLEHTITTIPQKMDGKKKYPQRSCRMCGKLGRRKDTRFMCSLCLVPFCKVPCFEIHAKTAANFEFPLVQF